MVIENLSLPSDPPSGLRSLEWVPPPPLAGSCLLAHIAYPFPLAGIPARPEEGYFLGIFSLASHGSVQYILEKNSIPN